MGATTGELAVDFLPGTIEVSRGTSADYRALAHLHYAAGRPATVAGVWRAEYCGDLRFPNCDGRLNANGGDCSFNRKLQIENRKSPGRLVGVAVLSYPTLSCRARERVLSMPTDPAGRARWINAHVRTISRVIVHPQFRALGIASALVRCVIAHCPTRLVESIAAMGAVHPFFEKAGMRRIEPAHPVEAAYFLFDRGGGETRRHEAH